MNQKLTIRNQRSFLAASGLPARQFFQLRSTRKLGGILLAVVLAGFSAARARAQGDMPSGTIFGYGSGPSYNYNLSFSDGASATGPIGSVWYGWVPGYFYLPGVPTSVSAPTGWTAMISGNSIEFYANSSSYYIQPGQSLSGFTYTASYSPATLASDTAASYSYSYMGGIETDAGRFFAVATVPEPSAVALFAMSALGLVLARRRRRAQS